MRLRLTRWPAAVAGAALVLWPGPAAAEVPTLFVAAPQQRAPAEVARPAPGPGAPAAGSGAREEAPAAGGPALARVDFAGLSALRDAVEGGVASRLRIDLYRDLSFDAVLDRATRTERGYALTGRVEGEPSSAVVLVANGESFHGSVWTSAGAYGIGTAGSAQVVERLPPSAGGCAVAPGGAGPASAEGAAPASASASASDAPADDGSEIDVLVFYTAAGRRYFGGHRNMLARIDHHVAWTNAAYELSEAAQRIRLVGASELAGFAERPGDHSLHFARDPRVVRLRDGLAADLLLLATSGGGGFASRVVTDASQAYWGYAQAGAYSPNTFAHELGHLMGLNHPRGENDTGNVPFPYSHGYLAYRQCPVAAARAPSHEDEECLPGDWAYFCTIMCSSPIHRLPRFSNPRHRHLGVPIGVPGDEPSDRADGPADAARSLDGMRRAVAGFRRSAERCRYRLLPAERVVPAEGGVFRVRVEAPAGCAWEAEAADGPLRLEGERRGVGAGEVSYAVPANEGWEREAAVSVAGRMHVAVQRGPRRAAPACGRSAAVREALEAETGKPCADIATGDLLRVDTLTLGGVPYDSWVPELVRGDFHGLENLGSLRLYLAREAPLARGAFEGLENLQHISILSLWDLAAAEPGAFEGLGSVRSFYKRNNTDTEAWGWPGFVSTPPAGVFRGLSGVRTMHLGDYRPELRLEPGAFEGLDSLERLTIFAGVRSLPAGVLRGLPRLRTFNMKGFPDMRPAEVFGDVPGLRTLIFQGGGPPLRRLEPGALRVLSSLEWLWLCCIEPPRPGVFDGLARLRLLELSGTALSELPPGLFAGLPRLELLKLQGNELERVPREVLAGVPKLVTLDLGDNRIAALEPGNFRGLGRLRRLRLHGNRLRTLPADAFEGLHGLVVLELEENRLEALPAGAFGLPELGVLLLHGNRLRTLPAGAFAGMREAWAVTLHGNPGAPFELALRPERASPAWRRPATVAVRLAEGAPAALGVRLSASGTDWSARLAALPAGASRSVVFELPRGGAGPVEVRVAGAPELPGVRGCAGEEELLRNRERGRWPVCFSGMRLAAGAPLTLNGVPDRTVAAAATWRIELADVFLEFDAPPPSYRVESSDPRVASAAARGGVLSVSARDAGTSTVVVTAIAADGRVASRSFTVTVPAGDARPFLRGWRLELLEEGAPP